MVTSSGLNLKLPGTFKLLIASLIDDPSVKLGAKNISDGQCLDESLLTFRPSHRDARSADCFDINGIPSR